MKGIKKLLLILMLVIPFVTVDAACINSDGTGKKGNISLSASSLSVNVGKKTTFKISAPCAAGRLAIASSDTSIATISPSGDQFVDDSSITVTVKGKKAGKVTINVSLLDVADYAGNVLGGTKKVTVNVKTPPTTTTKAVSDKPTTTTKKTTTTTTKKVVKEIKVSKFNIVGYNINFDPNVFEYTIEVAPNVNNLYIDLKGENFTATGDKEVNIEGKNSVVVSLKNGDKVQDYTININRTEAAVAPEIKEVVKEVVKTNNTFLYTTIVLAIVCVVLGALLIKGKNKVSETPNYGRVATPRSITPIQTTYINSVNTASTTSSSQAIPPTQSSVVSPTQNVNIQPTDTTVNPNSNNLQ